MKQWTCMRPRTDSNINNCMIKTNEIPTYRNKILAEQNYICPLCEQPLAREDAVLDHDHETGYIRGALHLSCNRSEGDIVKAWKFSRSKNYNKFIDNVVKYQRKDYTNNEQHPKHKDTLIRVFKSLKKHEQMECICDKDALPAKHTAADRLKQFKKEISQKQQVIKLAKTAVLKKKIK